MVFRFKRRGGTPQFHEGKFRQKAGICPHDWLHVRVELECLSLAKCALDGWSLKAAAKSAQRLCLCETCGSQPDMKFIIFFTLVRLPTLLNSSYKFYPSPKKIYTSVTCDNFHVWSQRLTLAKYFSTSDKYNQQFWQLDAFPLNLNFQSKGFCIVSTRIMRFNLEQQISFHCIQGGSLTFSTKIGANNSFFFKIFFNVNKLPIGLTRCFILILKMGRKCPN